MDLLIFALASLTLVICGVCDEVSISIPVTSAPSSEEGEVSGIISWRVAGRLVARRLAPSPLIAPHTAIDPAHVKT